MFLLYLEEKKLCFLKMCLSTLEPLKVLQCTCQACEWRCNEATEIHQKMRIRHRKSLQKLSCKMNRHKRKKKTYE